MEFELHIKGTIEEISQITTLIEKKLERDKSMFDCLKPKDWSFSEGIKYSWRNTVSTSVMPSEFHVPTKKKKTGWTRVRPVDILMGSSESWFAIWKSYNTMQAAAQALGLKEAANIQYYLKNDRIYKGMYKFQYRDLWDNVPSNIIEKHQPI